MIKHINLTVREHVDRRISLSRPAAAEYSESTGIREVIKYTGPWEAILEHGVQAVSGTEGAVAVTVEMERQEGGVGEMTITEETYRLPLTGEDGDEEEQELGSEAAPCYSSSSSLVQVNILAHPKFSNMSDLERRALKAMIDGQDEYSYLEDSTSTSGTRRIIDCIKSDVAKRAFSYISRGVTSYYDVSTETTARWKGRSNRYTAGTVVETAPGGFQSGADRNFLCSGTGVEKTGKETWCSASFRMSSAGGWDEYLYSGD